MPPRTVNIQDAKAQFSELIRAVEAGETVVICRRNVPVAEITSAVPPPPREFGKNLLGTFTLPDDFNDPLSEEELAEWERPIDL